MQIPASSFTEIILEIRKTRVCSHVLEYGEYTCNFDIFFLNYYLTCFYGINNATFMVNAPD